MFANRTSARTRTLVTVLAVLTMSFGALLVSTPRASATTYVRGWITADTTWGIADTEYVLMQHVTVRPGVTLTIVPGTTVKFDPGRALFVEGTLIANGFPGNEIAFQQNNTAAIFPPQGIQFNASSTGSVDRSTFDRFERPVTAVDSSPWIGSNFVGNAFVGFYLVRSNSFVWGNAIDRATIGIFLSESGATVLSNYVNNTSTGIWVGNSGMPTISQNAIVNTTAGVAIGIHVTSGASANLQDNFISTVVGTRGPNGFFAGSPGGAGGTALGILVDTPGTATILNNIIGSIFGGTGGNGVDNPGGVGGRGGDGGPAAAIVTGITATVDMWGNSIVNVYGGRGGNGGGSPTTNLGGNGGDAGDAAGIETLGVGSWAYWNGNGIDGVTGGVGGNGGDAILDGNGGTGGDAFGLFVVAAMNGDASGNNVQNVRGGPGGNATSAPTGTGNGGAGGSATGIGIQAVAGSAIIHTNTILTITGGNGGRGSTGGSGGVATGAHAIGNGDGAFNATSATGNWIQDLVGGDGALGARVGGPGGTTVGMTMALVTPFTGADTVWNVRGGDGGDAVDGTDGGRGGDAVGYAAYLVMAGWSAGDAVVTVTKGSPGAGPPVQTAYASGFYSEGNASVTSRYTVENATIAGTGDYDLRVMDSADATTINTPFNPGKLAIGTTKSTLTVKNFLTTEVRWPDGITDVAGASILVEENGAPVWSFVSATGYDEWLLTTDRVYVNSANAPNDVRNEVTVSYLSYNFLNNQRTVDMASSNTQLFIMIDSDAPTSAADALPPYETIATFAVTYTASDGNGAGLGDITLHYRKDGGGWTPYATQPASFSGSFTFTSVGDGTYEFATIADDLAGNTEPGPSANETWTIVDTTRPGSAVAALPIWTTTQSFPVSWGPDPSVTDIASYTVQFNRGFGWTTWLAGVTFTAATFTASQPWGVYEFRSIATDRAGTMEIAPATNDTWTRIDMEPPASAVNTLSTYQTSLTFTVSWRFLFDNFDTASYQVDVRDNGGAWTTWFPATTATSAGYTGVDGHLYEFRSIATDYAGNVEEPPLGNDTWTIVDVTEPGSRVNTLPTFTTSTTIALGWGPESGTTDAASYTIQVSDNGGAWTNVPGLVGTTATSGSHSGLDGHAYAFRSIATDRAGNVEPTSAGNDTWTVVDVTPPSTTSSLSGTLGNNNWYTTAVTVTLAATDATSGVASTAYRVDGGGWLTYGAPFAVSGDGFHKVEYYSTDDAGLAEGTRSTSFYVDATPPTTTASLVGNFGDNGWYVSPVSVTLTAGDPASGVAATSYRLDGGAWTTYGGSVPITSDGSHTVDFYSTDNAGLQGTSGSVSFRLDLTRPSVTNTSPRGAGTNTTPSIVITFDEAMNRASVEASFSITPDMNGAFAWSADNRTVTFLPDRTLLPATDYFVAIDSSAKDMAGNTLSGSTTFSFTTLATPPSSGTADFLWIIAVIAAGLGATLFIVMRRLGVVGAKPEPVPVAAKPKSETAIDDVFLLYRDGILIKHETRRLKPDIDTDILSGMLTAVQSFVKDSFRSEEGELDELTFGEMHILIGRGKWLILAAMVQGDGTNDMRPEIEKCIEEMEAKHAALIESWDGNMSIAKTLSPFIKKLIRSEYV